MRALLIVCALASIARADAPRLVIGRPTGAARIAHVGTSFTVEQKRVVVKLTFELVGRDPVERNIALQLRLPVGARASGLAIAGVADGYALSQEQAREEYAYTIRHYHDDPVLLEWRSHTAAGDVLVLRAYPVSADSSLTAEVMIEMPPATALLLEVGNQTTAIPVVAPPPPQSEVPLYTEPLVIAPRATERTPATFVGPRTSLLAGSLGGPTNDPVAEILEPDPAPAAAPIGGPDRNVISDVVAFHRAQLRRCYMYEAQRDHTLAGVVVMRFAIKPDGTTAVHPFEGTLASERVRSCIAHEVASWQFTRSDESTEVTYPLTFVLRP